MMSKKHLQNAWARLMYFAIGTALADNTPVPILSVRLKVTVLGQLKIENLKFLSLKLNCLRVLPSPESS